MAARQVRSCRERWAAARLKYPTPHPEELPRNRKKASDLFPPYRLCGLDFYQHRFSLLFRRCRIEVCKTMRIGPTSAVRFTTQWLRLQVPPPSMRYPIGVPTRTGYTAAVIDAGAGKPRQVIAAI